MRLALLVLVVVGLILFALHSAHADEVADARAFIAKQIELIKRADVDGLKATFTARLRDKIVKATVDAAVKEASRFTLDDLVATATSDGKSRMKITMKSGRSLTTLVKVDGAWQADTIWFK